jgi:hypothetical protein
VTSRKRLEAEYKKSTPGTQVQGSERKSDEKEEKKEKGDGAKTTTRCPAPKNDMPTRFSSTYHMLKELNEVAVCMNTVLISSPKATTQRLVLMPDVRTAMSEALAVIEPLHEVSTALSCELMSRIGSVAPRFHRLKEHLEKVIATIGNSDVQDGARASLQDLTEVRLPHVNTLLHRVASALDPNEKELKFLKQDTKAIGEVWATISKECKKVKLDVHESSFVQVDAGSDDDYSVEDLSGREEGTLTRGESVTNEIRRYRAAPPRYGTSLLKWWNENKSGFPHVAKVARKYLSVMATSMPCERLFSTGGNIVTVKRTRLTDYHVSAQMFLKVNYEWVFGDFK